MKHFQALNKITTDLKLYRFVAKAAQQVAERSKVNKPTSFLKNKFYTINFIETLYQLLLTY